MGNCPGFMYEAGNKRWIWTSGISSGEEDKNDNMLRSEWAKHRAHAARTKEEVLYLKEEMCRVLEFLEWKAEWWKERRQPRSDISKELAEGITAYSLSKETLQRALADHFRILWKSPLEETVTESVEVEDNMVTDGQERDDNDNDNDRDDDDEGHAVVNVDEE